MVDALGATRYVYDAVGQVLSEDGPWANDTVSYSCANRLRTGMRLMQPGAGLWSQYYAYDKAIKTFGVNSLNELTNVSRTSTANVAVTSTSTATNVALWVNGTQVSGVVRYKDATWAMSGATLLNGTNSFLATAQDSLGRASTNSSTAYLPASINYTYDVNGNLLSDDTRNFTYDDENQLVSAWVTNAWRSDFVYDGKMRRRVRVEKTWSNSTWQTNVVVLYAYDGSLVIQERNANNIPQVTYTRGKDLSGSLQGAGGIGGLLARTDNTVLTAEPALAHAYYHCDGNGNVTCLINTNQVVVARYLYDPFGNQISKSGSLADANLYRFSSKEFHANSGLVYYLYRFYDPGLQRWPNRDPIEEDYEINLFSYVGNDPIDYEDPLGLFLWPWQKPVRIDGGNPTDRKDVKHALHDVLKTPRGIELKHIIRRCGKQVTVHITKNHTANATCPGQDVNIDPTFHPTIPTAAGPRPAPTDRILGRELGHAVTGTDDDGPGRMNNVNQNENPIAIHLPHPEPPRTQY